MNHLNNRWGSSRNLIFLCAIGMVFFLVWAGFSRVDQVTRAPGTVIPSSRNQVIQAMEQSIVSEILVREGDLVKKGQTLIKFNRARNEAAWLETRSRVVAAQAAVARLMAEMLEKSPDFPPEVFEYPDILKNHQILFQKKQFALSEDIRIMKESLSLVRRELEMTRPLLQTGDVSEVEILRLERQAVELEGKIVNRRNKYFEDTQTELSKARESLEALREQLAQQKELLEYTEIDAPMDGIVRDIKITTVGGVARTGDEVMQIVPIDDEYIVEAKVKPADIAWVRPGLPATIRFDAWDYMIYGSFQGKVVFISADTLNEDKRTATTKDDPYYRVHIRLAGKDLTGVGPESVKLQPGMTATADIKTGNNTILAFLSKPVIRTLHQSFGER